jgi:hypothetical protein
VEIQAVNTLKLGQSSSAACLFMAIVLSECWRSTVSFFKLSSSLARFLNPGPMLVCVRYDGLCDMPIFWDWNLESYAYCHEFMVPWLIITGFGLHDWIY